MSGKEYLKVMGITDDVIYDNAEREHSLECLLEDYHEQQVSITDKRYTEQNMDDAYDKGWKDGFTWQPKIV